jgi:NADPH-dependent 2,4-dienoyl-CoA reductase/sulfur reductase-like enzyme
MAGRTIVVLGGALAGPIAARSARETDREARVILVERASRVSYAVGGLACALSGEVASPRALEGDGRAGVERHGVEVWTGAEAVRLDAAGRRLTLRRGGTSEEVAYDALVFALGAASVIPDAAGLTGENVRTLRTIDDVEALLAALRSGRRRVTVLGGGPFGVEAADGLVRGGADVTLLERSPEILRRFSPRIAAAARRELSARGRVVTGAEVRRAHAAGTRVERLELSDGTTVDTDFVVACCGLVPRTELLAEAGARLAADRSAAIDARAETSLPGVFACGVCVSTPQVVTGAPSWWPQGAIADKSAQVAGANAAGGTERLGPTTGTMLVRILDLTAGRTGLAQAEAEGAVGKAHVRTVVVEAPSHEAWFPASAAMLVSLTSDARTGRLLGVEAIGRSGVDKRVDVAACAVAAGMTVDQLAALDLGYGPAYGPARDPLNVAAGEARSASAGPTA